MALFRPWAACIAESPALRASQASAGCSYLQAGGRYLLSTRCAGPEHRQGPYTWGTYSQKGAVTPQSEKSSWGQTSGWTEREGEGQGALLGAGNVPGQSGPPEGLPWGGGRRGEGTRGGLAEWSGLSKSPGPLGRSHGGGEGRRDALALLAVGAGSATFLGGPGCHPTGLGKAPGGRLVSGLEKLVPPPLSLEFQERVWGGTGGSLHSTGDGNGRRVGEERRQRKHMGEGTSEPERLQPVRNAAWLDLAGRLGWTVGHF